MRILPIKIISFILVLLMNVSMITTVFAIERDSYSINGNYVQELIDMDDDQLKLLPIKEAKILFEKAFLVQADKYTEEEIRLGLNGLAFSLKFQNDMDKARELVESQPYKPVINSAITPFFSTNGSMSYSGEVGIAWIRDTKKGCSPLTLGEILSGTYTLEVDFITWDTAAAILAASANYNTFKDLLECTVNGIAGNVLSAYICNILGITGSVATVSSFAVGTVVGFGWNWLKNIDRSRMYNCFTSMNKSKNQYMKVEFMWSRNMVNKFYSVIPKTKWISNPFPEKFAEWYDDTFGYLYNY